jgi:hypothetical protein
MIQGFRICIDWRNRKELPELSQEEILDTVADTVVDMAIENGKLARTLHEVLLRVTENQTLSEKDVTYLRNVIIGNLGRQHADPFSKEKHKD